MRSQWTRDLLHLPHRRAPVALSKTPGIFRILPPQHDGACIASTRSSSSTTRGLLRELARGACDPIADLASETTSRRSILGTHHSVDARERIQTIDSPRGLSLNPVTRWRNLSHPIAVTDADQAPQAGRARNGGSPRHCSTAARGPGLRKADGPASPHLLQ